MLSLIQRALRASIEGRAERLGPFVVRFDDHNDNPFLNYAIPDDDAAPTSQDVDSLIAAFIGRARRPRLEYITPSLNVDRAFEAAGFVTDVELALMTATPATFIKPPAVSGLELQHMTPDDDLWAVVSVQNAAYGETAPVGQHNVDNRRTTLQGGGGVVLARYFGTPVGAGLFTPPKYELAEICGVGVLAAYRRRHIASATAAALTEAVFAAGATPYLQTETVNEERLYGSLGYMTVGHLTTTSLP
jgi:ribosomal protein S18 acetylase RimI-like enzyme